MDPDRSTKSRSRKICHVFRDKLTLAFDFQLVQGKPDVECAAVGGSQPGKGLIGDTSTSAIGEV
jgi:hypothetical protein